LFCFHGLFFPLGWPVTSVPINKQQVLIAIKPRVSKQPAVERTGGEFFLSFLWLSWQIDGRFQPWQTAMTL
jgi:hypothetical protein